MHAGVVGQLALRARDRQPRRHRAGRACASIDAGEMRGRCDWWRWWRWCGKLTCADESSCICEKNKHTTRGSASVNARARARSSARTHGRRGRGSVGACRQAASTWTAWGEHTGRQSVGTWSGTCTAANRLLAKYAPLQRAAMWKRLSGSVSPEPAIGMASARVTCG